MEKLFLPSQVRLQEHFQGCSKKLFEKGQAAAGWTRKGLNLAKGSNCNNAKVDGFKEHL